MNETAPEVPKATTFRLDPDVLQMLDAWRRANRRTRNSAVNYLLAKALLTGTAQQADAR